jgi:hypothetical protein
MIRSTVVALLVASVAAAPLAAQEPVTPDVPHAREGNMGVGLQLTWPAYGISGMFDLSDRFSLQGVLGSAGYGASLTARGIFRTAPQEMFTPFFYGQAGMWTGYRAHGSVPNFGVGGGIEIDVRKFVDEFPPVYVGFESGLSMTVFSGGTWTWFQIGPSIHYRF